eukprot:scaffold101929_cov54-Phaeocystis_antarctica.AAC.1
MSNFATSFGKTYQQGDATRFVRIASVTSADTAFGIGPNDSTGPSGCANRSPPGRPCAKYARMPSLSNSQAAQGHTLCRKRAGSRYHDAAAQTSRPQPPLLTWRPPPAQEPRHRHAAAGTAGGLAWRRALRGAASHSGSAATEPAGARGVRRATRRRPPRSGGASFVPNEGLTKTWQSQDAALVVFIPGSM